MKQADLLAPERWIVKLCQLVLWVSMTIIFFILSVNTILRYAVGSSLQWANEVPELLFPWLVMAGVVLAAIQGAHITTSFLLDRFKPITRQRIHGIGSIVTVFLYVSLFVAAWRMLDIAHDEKSPILGVPASVTYACVMIGMFLLACLAGIGAWRAFTGQTLASSTDSAQQAHF